MSKPRRWLDAPEQLNPAERRVLASRSFLDPPPAMQDAIWQALDARLAPPPGSPNPNAPPDAPPPARPATNHLPTGSLPPPASAPAGGAAFALGKPLVIAFTTLALVGAGYGLYDGLRRAPPAAPLTAQSRLEPAAPLPEASTDALVAPPPGHGAPTNAAPALAEQAPASEQAPSLPSPLANPGADGSRAKGAFESEAKRLEPSVAAAMAKSLPPLSRGEGEPAVANRGAGEPAAASRGAVALSVSDRDAALPPLAPPAVSTPRASAGLVLGALPAVTPTTPALAALPANTPPSSLPPSSLPPSSLPPATTAAFPAGTTAGDPAGASPGGPESWRRMRIDGPGTSGNVASGRTPSVVPRPELAPIADPGAQPSSAPGPGPRVSDGAPARGGASLLREESASLEQARRAIQGGDARRGLVLVEQAKTRFAKSLLSQEWEVLAIEALWRAGQRPNAAARAKAFLRAHPASMHAERLRSFTNG